MSLIKQVYLVVFIVISAIFVMFTNNFIFMKYSADQVDVVETLSQELNVASNNFFNSLAKNDLGALKIMEDVLVTKKYKSIEIVSEKGKKLFSKKLDNNYKAKTNWLLDRYKITNKRIYVPVKLNNQDVFITATVSTAYMQAALWHKISSIVKKILFLYFIFVAISFAILYVILKPLKIVTMHAKKLSNKEFFLEEELPLAGDVRTIADSLNNMSLKVKKTFTENNEFSELMRSNTYRDTITGLGNKDYFRSNLEQMLRGSESGIGGLLIVVQIKLYPLHAEYLSVVARNLLGCAKKKSKITMLSHFGDGKFALIVKNIMCGRDKEVLQKEISAYGLLLIDKLSSIKVDGNKLDCTVYVGITEYQQGTFVRDLISQAESALGVALLSDESKWSQYDGSQKVSLLPDVHWNSYLRQALEEKKYVLHYQPVYFYEKDGTLLFHNEVLIRLLGPKKELIMSGSFLPIAYQENLGVEFDQSVVESLLERIKDNKDGWQRYGINLSAQSLHSKPFLEWLEKRLQDAGELARRITFEFAEEIACKDMERFETFINVVEKYGVQVGLDHFGCNFKSFEYLEKLKVAYLKVDGNYTRKIESNPYNQAIVRSFVDIAHSVDILVFATCVETDLERDALSKLHIDGMEGYLMGQPI